MFRFTNQLSEERFHASHSFLDATRGIRDHPRRGGLWTAMLLSDEQIELLRGDLDYILPRTTCNSVLLHRGHVLNAMERDPDVLLDLVEGMQPADARWLSVPIDSLRPLISSRLRGGTRTSEVSQPLLIDA